MINYIKLAAILYTFAFSSLCIGMEDLEKLRQSDVKTLAQSLNSSALKNRINREEYIKNTMSLIKTHERKNNSLPLSIPPLETLRTYPATLQLAFCAALFKNLYEGPDSARYEFEFLRGALLLIQEHDNIYPCQGYIMLVYYYYINDNFKSGLECINILSHYPLQKELQGILEQRLAEIFKAKPQAIKHFVDSKGQGDFYSPDNIKINAYFLTALNNLKTFPTMLDGSTLYSIGKMCWRGYFKTLISYLSKKKEGSKAFLNVPTDLKLAMRYLVWSAKAGNINAFKDLTTFLNQIITYEQYYDVLIPLLQTDEPGAQDLFNEVCYQSKGALNCFQGYLESARSGLNYKLGCYTLCFEWPTPETLQNERNLFENVLNNYYSYLGQRSVDSCSGNAVIQGTDLKPIITNTNYTVSTTEATSTASSTPTRAKKRSKNRKDQKLHQPPDDCEQNQGLNLISAQHLPHSELVLSTVSGEGSNVQTNDLREDLSLPIAKKLKSSASKSEKEPKGDEKTTKTKVTKTLERKNSGKILTRRNSYNHSPIESDLDPDSPHNKETRRKELKRTVTVSGPLSYTPTPPGKTETNDENKKPHKYSLSKTLNLSNFNPWKDKKSQKRTVPLDEKAYVIPEEKQRSRSLRTNADSSASESEGELKKSSSRREKKSSSSSLNSSMESSQKIKNPTDTLINLKMLPQNPDDYYPRHYRRLHKILTHKYNLNKEHQDTLWVILDKRERTFEINTDDIKNLFSQFTTQGSHHGRHEVIDGMGVTLNPNADGVKKRSYTGLLNQLKEKITTNIAQNLTFADYEAAHEPAHEAAKKG